MLGGETGVVPPGFI